MQQKKPDLRVVKVARREVLSRGLQRGLWNDNNHRAMTMSWPRACARVGDPARRTGSSALSDLVEKNASILAANLNGLPGSDARLDVQIDAVAPFGDLAGALLTRQCQPVLVS